MQTLAGQLKSGDCANQESCLVAALLGHPHLTEVTITQAQEVGFDGEGQMLLGTKGRRQISVFRSAEGDDASVCTRSVAGEDGNFKAHVRCRSPQRILSADKDGEDIVAVDPTESDAFKTPASKSMRGQILRSDLSWSSLDDTKPIDQRRVVLVYILGVEDQSGHLLAVIKAGIEAKVISEMVRKTKVNALSEKDVDPFIVFLADDEGRLVSGPSDKERPTVDGDDLRVKGSGLQEEVAQALKQMALADAAIEQPSSGTFEIKDRAFHVSYRALANTWGWRVGVVGPEDYYLGPLKEQRRQMLLIIGFGMLVAFIAGLIALRLLQGSFRQIQDQTRAMSSFDFSKREVDSSFQEVYETLFSLEVAKTAVRAMGRYVPVPLVQKLFSENREPSLGGYLREISIFFSDIEGFTTRAEEEAPDVVAHWLGEYLEVMTDAVHQQGGTVDKFIGDSVMALWNAPASVEDHAARACRAALLCQKATQDLYASEKWRGREPLVTRIGLHMGQAMVGHFGSNDRLNYTAIGDAVNLASRLESLNRHYGTRLIVSDTVRDRVKDLFHFRRLDVVKVKGKNQAVVVYELLAEKIGDEQVDSAMIRYEQALDLFMAGDFVRARELLVQNTQDPASRALLIRCDDQSRGRAEEI